MTAMAPARSEPVSATRLRYRLTITGTVQGVGFRPFLYRQAAALGLGGYAINAIEGVIVEVEGTQTQINTFVDRVHKQAPVNAQIMEVKHESVLVCHDRDFRIRESSDQGISAITVPPDLASCDTCIEEVFNPDNRRYRYPFTNCVECGPRYSIIQDMPWDRARTGMSGFSLCAVCTAEYQDPGDRRFHAETNCCPDCGPQLSLRDASGNLLADKESALQAAVVAIRQGAIVAIKGPGGYQLLVNASDAQAVALLRTRKRRPAKPFAVMFPSLEAIHDTCHVNTLEERLLTGREHPIVLLKRRDSCALITPGAAPGNPYLGAMLPAMPLQHLLLNDLGFPVIATSGNRSDEPITINETEAVNRLAGIADYFLTHDRPILRPLDDSVVRVSCGKPQVLRRARGYAPLPVATDLLVPGVIAGGAHLKATVAVSRRNDVVLSQHIGDLDNPQSRDNHAAALEQLTRLYRISPQAYSCDLHPDYTSTHSMEQYAEESGLPLLRVQHHLAHTAAVMAEHRLQPPVLGVALDGTGYGADGTIWGGEFIAVTDRGWVRKARLRHFCLPGGHVAIREPRRAALGLLFELYGKDLIGMDQLPPVADFSRSDRQTLVDMLDKGINAPMTSSAGRLFDAVSALTGLCQIASYEGEAACKLEWTSDSQDNDHVYIFDIIPARDGSVDWVIDWEPVITQILDDIAGGVATARIARAFHRGLADAVTETAIRIGIESVALTGGCFQNNLLTELSVSSLGAQGFQVYRHEQVPPGDGSIALGQAYWTAKSIKAGEI